ncbi:MAG: hypothetical protein GX754_01855 [Clostridiaceae bacterium]|nr:hypothetical protein [Clostridiaceae bacterium]
MPGKPAALGCFAIVPGINNKIKIIKGLQWEDLHQKVKHKKRKNVKTKKYKKR